MGRKLTVKQEKFCNKYLECGNASEAYRFAYDCENWSAEAIHVQASKMLSNPNIRLRIEHLKNNLAEASGISALKIIKEYEKVAFSSIAHMHNTWIERREFESLTEEQKACIKSIQTKTQRRMVCDEPVEVEYVKIELYDKLSALSEIKKMLGYDAPIKSEVKTEAVTVSYK